MKKQGLLGRGKRAVGAKRDAAQAEGRAIVLVGTYKSGQLAWIKRHGLYNYPIKDGDQFTETSCRQVKELWLYADAKAKRHCFAAEFVGIQSKDEFLAANPTYAKLGSSKHARYMVFKAKWLEYGPKLEASTVVARVSDFSDGRSKKVAKAIRQFHDGGEFGSLADYLPGELAELPREQLRVCEAAVQMDFLSMIFSGKKKKGYCVPACVSGGHKPIIDLFAGCGGMSLGFEMAGFSPLLAVEKDAWASETYASNREGVKVVTGDITKITDPEKLLPFEKDIFGIIGGPPCQGFSLSGGRDPKDPRNSLFMDYMRFVKAYHPSFFVMENVPGILSSVTKKGELVKEVIISVAKELGYHVHLVQLDASHFGVPQARQRVFFIGIRSDYPFDPSKLTPLAITKDNPITLWQAISDLPQILACQGEEIMQYEAPASNQYQEWCRDSSDTVKNHVAMRHTQRLIARFHVIKYGESAADVPLEHMQRKRGDASVISGKKYSQNNMRPYPDKPSPTVPASFQSNFVHPYLDRNFTAREGARLQSFPDSYVFRGRRTTMSWEKNLSQYQQIGNAVPPLLARAIARTINEYFENIQQTTDHSEESR